MTQQEMIAAHIAKNGVTKCAPAHAHGNEMRGASRRHVSKVRGRWSETNGVALKIGQVRS
jgi:hypothetical protein